MDGAIGGAAITVDVAANVAGRCGEFAVERAFEPFGGKAKHLGSDASQRVELVLVDAQFLWRTDLFEANQRLVERSEFVEFADAV